MADKKISQLTAVSIPLAGTEVLPIVQSGATKKVTAIELTGVNVTTDGRVGVGGVPDTTVNGSPITAKFGVHQDGGSTNYPVVGAVKYSDVTSTAGVTICGARGRGSKATPTVVSNGDLLSSHIAAGYDGTDFAISSRINFEVDGPTGNDDMPGRIVFLTAADGSQTPTEAMRISSEQVAEFVNPPSAPGYQLSSGGLIVEATTSRTLSAVDNGKIIYCTNGAATTITCAAGLGAGFSCTIIQGGAGKITVDAGAATLVSYSSLFSTMGQYAVISLVAPVADTFIAAGNLGV